MSAGFRADDATLFQAVSLCSCADDFEVDGSVVTVFVQDADITDEVNVAATIGLVCRVTGTAFSAFAVADVDVFDARDNGCDGFYWIFVCAVNVRGVHVNAKGGR